ncbi:MAG TPA: glycosyltransferase [Candidatus Aquabacterium excrementipullorum]|nr:glycosyltransferase [Candidatus Aquabacterium excrementipullorum]
MTHSCAPAPKDERVSVVVLTFNRPTELRHTLGQLSALPERPPIVVVDNGSQGPGTNGVLKDFPDVQAVRCHANLGAAGRNAGVAQVRTPYVAFCDDDTWWSPGALKHAADVLDSHPQLGALSARVLVGPQNRDDPTCERMARSPLAAHGLPGPALIAFMAGAVVMRAESFRAAGGYEPRLFLGAEEALLALDMAARGWRMAYVPTVTTHHHPSPARNNARRLVATSRNRIWIAWMRLPWSEAWLATFHHLREARRQALLGPVLAATAVGLPWALRHRQVLPPDVLAMHKTVFGSQPPRQP